MHADILRARRYQGMLSTSEVEVAGRPLTFPFDLAAGVTSLDAAIADEMT